MQEGRDSDYLMKVPLLIPIKYGLITDLKISIYVMTSMNEFISLQLIQGAAYMAKRSNTL